MAKMLYRTKGNATPGKKPRVYFTCHPDDFDKHFENICADIFEAHDCAIYYTEDMAEPIPEEDYTTDLESNNLFVVPVTLKLLTSPNRAMDHDIPFALQQHIPVLPILVEPGIETVYARPDKFGELQYLNSASTDATEVSYKEKLKKYLESVLISSETANRVRGAFDAYIFLSYRKKDRRYANELMRLIHAHPECRDIAIWYDEFLTPGESFRANIEKVLSSSKLFTLLVTPNVLEEANFVMTEEYPAAKKSGIHILPTEMEETDKNLLREKFLDIPPCADPHNESFKTRLLESVEKISDDTNDDDPEHNFLIGLAYLEGIDVEIDRQRGLELITKAAEAGLPEAMEKLYNMYENGTGVPLDYREALKWIQKLADHYTALHGEAHPKTLLTLNNLAHTQQEIGAYAKSTALYEKIAPLAGKVFGMAHPITLTIVNNLSNAYSQLGNYEKALKYSQAGYDQCLLTLGEEHPKTLLAIHNLAANYHHLKDYAKAQELLEKAYALQYKVLGEEHRYTLASLRNLALTYAEAKKPQIDLSEKAYILHCKVLGEEHPDTLAALHALASAHTDLGDHQKARELVEKTYTLRCKVLGQEHPDTLITLFDLALAYGLLGNFQKTADLLEKAYPLQCKILGEEHPKTMQTLTRLADTYNKYLNDPKKALKSLQLLFVLRSKILGPTHTDTLLCLNDLADVHLRLNEPQKAQKMSQTANAELLKQYGLEHPHTLSALRNTARCIGVLGDHAKALDLHQKVFSLRCKLLGANHLDSIVSLHDMAFSYFKLGDLQNSMVALSHAYQSCVKAFGPKNPHTQYMLKEFSGVWDMLSKQRKEENVCLYCGGAFTGQPEVCSKCGKPKDY